MKATQNYLNDILQSIERIERYTELGKDTGCCCAKLQDYR